MSEKFIQTLVRIHIRRFSLQLYLWQWEPEQTQVSTTQEIRKTMAAYYEHCAAIRGN